ncbi:hypothetical protein FAM6410_00775 [Lacticaseibacillus paracasei]|nr:hypothetical protein FAM6410_00775 [Lacticaseibacillus paracasei]
MTPFLHGYRSSRQPFLKLLLFSVHQNASLSTQKTGISARFAQ